MVSKPSPVTLLRRVLLTDGAVVARVDRARLARAHPDGGDGGGRRGQGAGAAVDHQAADAAWKCSMVLFIMVGIMLSIESIETLAATSFCFAFTFLFRGIVCQIKNMQTRVLVVDSLNFALIRSFHSNNLVRFDNIDLLFQ